MLGEKIERGEREVNLIEIDNVCLCVYYVYDSPYVRERERGGGGEKESVRIRMKSGEFQVCSKMW